MEEHPVGFYATGDRMLKADKYLIIAQGNLQAVTQAREIMGRHQATEIEAIAA